MKQQSKRRRLCITTAILSIKLCLRPWMSLSRSVEIAVKCLIPATRVSGPGVLYARAILALSAAIVPFTPAFPGVPFVTDDPETPPINHFEINIAEQLTRIQGESFAAIPSVEVNYGLLSNVQISILTPLQLFHLDEVGTNVGIGDIEMGVKYRFIDADDEGWRPAVAIYPTITLPSGSQARGLGEGHILGFLPVWLSKEFDKWNVFGGGGYNINSGTSNRNWWFAGVGVTRELNSAWTIGAEVFFQTPPAHGLKNSTGFNVGVIYNINEVHHLMMSAGRNITNATEINQFSTYIGWQLTF